MERSASPSKGCELLRVQGAAALVDVAAVGRVVDGGDAGARPMKGAGTDLERGAVAGVHQDRKPIQVVFDARPEPGDVGGGEARVRIGRRGRRHGLGVLARVHQLLLEILLLLVGPLAAVGAEDLDAVVLVGIVRGGDRDSGGRAELQDELRDPGRRDDPGGRHAAAALAQPGRQVGHDARRRLAGVAPEHDAAVSAGLSQPPRELPAQQPH
jgi:hypothetical protein